jgi:hypothetical protein
MGFGMRSEARRIPGLARYLTVGPCRGLQGCRLDMMHLTCGRPTIPFPMVEWRHTTSS